MGINTSPYPPHGEVPWDGDLRTYIDSGDLVNFPAWQPLVYYVADSVVIAPDGSAIERTTAGNARATFDATEQAAWESVLTQPGTVAQIALSGTYVAFPSGGIADYAVASRKTGATNGFQWTTKEELVARALGWIIVTDARWGGGAKFDGTTDDGPAWRAAIAQGLSTAIPAVVWAPPGQSVICSTQRTTATTTDASDGHALAISSSNGNLTIKGSGKYATQIIHRGYGNVDPVTTWQTVGGNLWRGSAFWIDTNTPNICFESFDLDGKTHTTGTTTFPASNSTGDGWDLTHHAIAFKNNGTGWGINTIKDCRLHGYRGEQVLSNGDDSALLEIRNNEMWDSNAALISASRTLIMEDNYLHDAAYGTENTYRYRQSIQRNRIETMKLDGITMLPFSTGSAFGPCMVKENDIKLCDRSAISFSNGARNAVVEDNTATDCGSTSGVYPYLFQTASSLPIRGLTVRRNNYYGVTRNTPSNNGTFFINDSAGAGISKFIMEDNTIELTAEAVANGFTINQGFGFGTIAAANLSAMRIRNNRAFGTTFCYTDQDKCLETLLANTSNNVIAKRRPDRLTDYTISVSARVITATTTINNMYVSWTDAAGASHSYFWTGGSTPVGAVTWAPISITAAGPSDITVNAQVGTANQVYVTAKITET